MASLLEKVFRESVEEWLQLSPVGSGPPREAAGRWEEGLCTCNLRSALESSVFSLVEGKRGWKPVSSQPDSFNLQPTSCRTCFLLLSSWILLSHDVGHTYLLKRHGEGELVWAVGPSTGTTLFSTIPQH